MTPNSNNTGYIALTSHYGDLTITTPNTLIDGLDIHGYVVVKAANVVIRRSIIRGGSAATGNACLSIVGGGTNYLVEDVTISPEFPNSKQNAINVNQPGILRRLNISGTVDGIMIYGSGVNVQDSYIHDLKVWPTGHSDGGPTHNDCIQLQAGTGVRIERNSLTGANNAAIMVTQDAGVVKDLVIADNYLDNGGCSINFGSNGAPKTGIVVQNNRFGRNQRNVGCAIIRNATQTPFAVEQGNVWDDNNVATGIKKGA